MEDRLRGRDSVTLEKNLMAGFSHRNIYRYKHCYDNLHVQNNHIKPRHVVIELVQFSCNNSFICQCHLLYFLKPGYTLVSIVWLEIQHQLNLPSYFGVVGWNVRPGYLRCCFCFPFGCLVWLLADYPQSMWVKSITGNNYFNLDRGIRDLL